MAIKFKAPETKELRPRITVLGVGGGGCNAINNMIAAKLEGVELVAANTDAQALSQSKAERRVQLGPHVTAGLGAGAQPDVGRAAAEESLDDVMEQLAGSDMVFITAGMGGGTGTGAAPVIARAAREAGVLTVGVVTKPFAFEGDRRMRLAERGIAELQQYVHTLIVIPNQNLFRVANDRTTFAQAFALADEVLHAGVRGVTDLIVTPGLINPDFADIKAIISEMGKSMMGTGEAEGEDRALKAADLAICNPLLDDVSMKGARGVLINITGGPDLTLFEVEAAANRVRGEVDPDANIIFGNSLLDNMEGRIRVSVIATGIDADGIPMPKNVEPLRPYLKPLTRMPEPRPEPRPAVAASVDNQVHRQVKALADELGAVQTPVEAMILGGEEAPRVVRIGEDDIPPIPASIRPTREPMRAAPEPERRSWGLFGRKPKPEPRQEPVASSRPAAQRATSQVMSRTAPADPSRTAGSKPDDLFPEQKRDDQFDIPAFLRRQQN
jgi:cell division protein FtsZ